LKEGRHGGLQREEGKKEELGRRKARRNLLGGIKKGKRAGRGKGSTISKEKEGMIRRNPPQRGGGNPLQGKVRYREEYWTAGVTPA
jgi:hypothetical protein